MYLKNLKIKKFTMFVCLFLTYSPFLTHVSFPPSLSINFSHCRFPPHSDRKTAQVIINPKCWYLCFSQHIFCLLECVAMQPKPFCLQTALSNTQKECTALCLDRMVKETGMEGRKDSNTQKKEGGREIFRWASTSEKVAVEMRQLQ